jgi:hypothetical protein
MINLSNFPSPHVHIDNYSHMVMGDENIALEIIKAMKSPSPKWAEISI